MENTSIKEIKNLFPDEWVLLGNPTMDESQIDVISGVPIFHSKDKKEVCYLGRNMTDNFKTVTIIYTGNIKKIRTNGILRRL
ncbi:hypothetical protein [Flavobacterium sp.]|uniref:hypothetical protein n=1 Tax=Flavobacterium sp. TaxID=239 RepID=UPI0037527F5C